MTLGDYNTQSLKKMRQKQERILRSKIQEKQDWHTVSQMKKAFYEE